MSFPPFLLQILYFKLKKTMTHKKNKQTKKTKQTKIPKNKQTKNKQQQKKKKNTKQQHIYTNPECAKNGLISRDYLHSALPAPRSCPDQTLRSHR